MKFNSQQLLFEPLFNISGNFGSLQPKNEFTFPFQYNIIFETYQSFDPPSSTPSRDRDLCPVIFCTKFNSQQLLFEQFFDIIGNICSVQS